MICNHSWLFLRAASVAILAATLAACATSPTPYQAVSEEGGYADQQLESDRYRVKFEGNDATSRETVEDYALYRAAELTLQTGNDYFKVVSKEVEPVIGAVRGVSPGIGIGIGGGNVGFGLSTRFGGGRPDYSYVTYLDIIVYEGEKPEDDREAYGAFDVIERLKPAVVAAAEAGTEEAAE
ncbi:MAG: CC0125/CC1285 family lipoprotein [Geminicoccaceae bacterium]